MASKAEATLALHLRAAGIVAIPEYQFCEGRRWRADFAIPGRNLLIEVDGGNRMATIGKNGKAVAIGRHTLDADYEKLNEARPGPGCQDLERPHRNGSLLFCSAHGQVS